MVFLVAFDVVCTGILPSCLYVCVCPHVSVCAQGPFTTWTLDHPAIDVTSLCFSPSGHHLLVSTNEDFISLLDAFSGEQVCSLPFLSLFLFLARDDELIGTSSVRQEELERSEISMISQVRE